SRALALAAVIMVGLAIVPGFPSIVFLILGACFGAGAYAINRRTARESEHKDIGQIAMTEQPGNPASLSARSRNPNSPRLPMACAANSSAISVSTFPLSACRSTRCFQREACGSIWRAHPSWIPKSPPSAFLSKRTQRISICSM
ncbi:MAG: hypothetical protein E5W53_13275, partial [Mesorhizobium sp.]